MGTYFFSIHDLEMTLNDLEIHQNGLVLVLDIVVGAVTANCMIKGMTINKFEIFYIFCQ